ncbi:pilus assembly protein [Roseomonas sp. PWR1]|uniref:Pilus assembly protein n=1 Tax=Roseomonas nitratireducens TaxID=2820810 RepID=A0ABS4AWE4_9PROT|nr:TadE family protein [Neoroseomonas nitratireducens]MBP0465666.1 pilus assembly protein [Neoroseomonas nitratireducens]
MSNCASARARRFRRGSAGLEFAIVGGLFFVMLLAAVDLGRYYLTLHSIRTFAAEASRHGTVVMTGAGTQTLSGADLVAAVGRAGILGGAPGVTLTRTQTGAGSGTSIRVQVSVDHPFTWVINVFGVGTTRFRESTDITFQW